MFGVTASGSKRWINLFVFNLQPSELMKITLIMLLARYYSKIPFNDVNRIKFEDKSRNTYENFLFSKKFFDKKNNNNWLLITSAYHMKRSMSVAEKLDLNFIPYPVDFRTGKNFSWRFWYHRTNFLQNMNDFQLAAHEYIGLVAYYLTKKSSKIF